ncbi:MAG: TerB family tellurite resistance protein [Rhodocyclaceae bacterium]|nr:TerB family tellurite resistance protein [Rhodocyclaceae bacterium]
MHTEQLDAILCIALFAAFADGVKDDREREEVRRIAESLAGEAGAPDLARRYQDVLMKRVTLAGAAGRLADAGERHLAYEMAVCVCDADGRQTDAERRFLDELRGLLGLAGGEAADLARTPDALAEAAATAAAPGATAATPPSAAAAAPSEAELDSTILNHAILAGALELLPQSWASMAIIPLQLKLVHRVGRMHGVELDQGHIREFLAAAGVGLTSQYLEQFGRKLIGGLLGKMAGKTVGKVGRAATGAAFSFATTWALGQVARRYYAGGRRMSGELLRESFQNLLGPAKDLQTRYLPQIEQTAGGLTADKVMALVRG